MIYVVSSLISCYLALLSSFCFFCHPFINCVLMVLMVINLCFSLYLLLGVSWYICILCMVYVGGVYVLFIFVFFNCGNTGIMGGLGCFLWVLLIYVFSFLFVSSSVFGEYIVDENIQLSSFGYRFGYVLLCIGMIFCMGCVSYMCSDKNSFFR